MIASSRPYCVELGPESNGMLMTPEEFDAVEERDEFYEYELVNGVVIVNPPPGMFERSPNDELGHWVRAYQQHHPEGSCVDATAPEQMLRTGRNRRRCDRAVWIGLGRAPDEKVDPPAIAVEFPGKRARDRNRDYTAKRQEYADAGIQEYWILDLHRRQMTVHFADGRTKTLGPGETYRTDLMPGFELPFDVLLDDAEPYQQSS